MMLPNSTTAAILLIIAVKSIDAATCGICDGVEMGEPTKMIIEGPLFRDQTTDSQMTCAEKDAELALVVTTDEGYECLEAKIDYEIDLAVWCGCEGAGTSI